MPGDGCDTFFLLSIVHSIGCFVCQSINGSEPSCEDTFNNSGQFWQPNCMAGRRGRKGFFPATQCIKIVIHDGKHSDRRPSTISDAFHLRFFDWNEKFSRFFIDWNASFFSDIVLILCCALRNWSCWILSAVKCRARGIDLLLFFCL